MFHEVRLEHATLAERFVRQLARRIYEHQAPWQIARAVSGLEVIIKNAKAGDNHTDEVHKFKLWDKTRDLEALAGRLEVSGWDKLAAQLNHARTVGPTAST